MFYLGAGTSVSLLNLDNRAVQLEVTQGSIISRVRRFGPRDLIEFDTPNLAFSVRRPGVYRIDVDAADDRRPWRRAMVRRTCMATAPRIE